MLLVHSSTYLIRVFLLIVLFVVFFLLLLIFAYRPRQFSANPPNHSQSASHSSRGAERLVLQLTLLLKLIRSITHVS